LKKVQRLLDAEPDELLIEASLSTGETSAKGSTSGSIHGTGVTNGSSPSQDVCGTVSMKLSNAVFLNLAGSAIVLVLSISVVNLKSDGNSSNWNHVMKGWSVSMFVIFVDIVSLPNVEITKSDGTVSFG